MKNFRWIIKTLIFVFVLVICINRISDIVQRKNSDFKYGPFFEQKENFDVLFMGTSHVINGIFPMELWNEYGIVSYNFGGHSTAMATSYWIMENALDYTTPELVVVDVLAVGDGTKVSVISVDYLHTSFDCFPISYKKIKGIYDLCDNPDLTDQNGNCYYNCRQEFIWDFEKYHSRWNDIKANDFTNNMTKEKGAESRIAVAIPNEYHIVPKTQTMKDNNTVGMAYLKKMIEDCQRRGIEVLLVNLPYPATEDQQIAANSVYAVAEEYGVNYINFVAMDNVVDYSTDCYDAGSHLNPSGARKVTEYLGRYIKEHYDIPDRRKDEGYYSWFEDYKEYIDFKIDKINIQKTIETELMLLADKGFSSCIYIKKDSPVLQEEIVNKLLINLAGNENLEGIDEAVVNGESYCLVVDNGLKKWKCVGCETLNAKTSFGEISYRIQNGAPELYIRDNSVNRLDGNGDSAESDIVEPDIQIIVINNDTGEIVSESKWEYSSTNTITKLE